MTNVPAQDPAEIVDFFRTTTGTLLAAGRRAGVRHHVALSIVGLEHNPDVPHYAGKLAQEELIEAADVPWTIVRATQFHDFPAMVAGWAQRDGAATVAPLLLQPIAPIDVAQALAEVAQGEPLRGRIDVAGPHTEDLVDMTRRTLAARGEQVRLVPTWRGIFGLGMSGEVLLPGAGARLGRTSFDEAAPARLRPAGSGEQQLGQVVEQGAARPRAGGQRVRRGLGELRVAEAGRVGQRGPALRHGPGVADGAQQAGQVVDAPLGGDGQGGLHVGVVGGGQQPQLTRARHRVLGDQPQYLTGAVGGVVPDRLGGTEQVVGGLLHPAVQRRAQQVVPGVEVPVERALGRVQPARERLDRHRVRSLVEQHLDGLVGPVVRGQSGH